ncbi:MAG TPA: hypothetical protein VLM38_23605 [Blastocatellia bacterium]|nr:hypothetical protein [Blastocatellia bacterium]
MRPSGASTGGETTIERAIDRYLGNSIHLFLSVLALLILVAALITTFDTVVRDFPRLWQQGSEYSALQQIIENILLIAIAAELGLLLLFHRAAAAVEVVIFIIARKMVTPGIAALDLLLGAAALSGLIIVRFYYLSGKPPQE